MTPATYNTAVPIPAGGFWCQRCDTYRPTEPHSADECANTLREQLNRATSGLGWALYNVRGPFAHRDPPPPWNEVREWYAQYHAAKYAAEHEAQKDTDKLEPVVAHVIAAADGMRQQVVEANLKEKVWALYDYARARALLAEHLNVGEQPEAQR